MHEFVIDLGLVKKVWQNIEKIDDPRLVEKKAAFAYCEPLLSKALTSSAMPSLAAVTEISALSRQELAEQSLRVVYDVLTFIKSAYEFYDLVRSFRPFTEEEKDIGRALALLLQQVQTIVPGDPGKKKEKSTMRESDDPGFTDGERHRP
jgi:hypothetical protein